MNRVRLSRPSPSSTAARASIGFAFAIIALAASGDASAANVPARPNLLYVFAQDTAVGVIGNKNPFPKRAVRDSRYKLIRNLAPENEWWINGIHGGEVFKSWVRDAARNPALAARVRALSHRPAEELYDLQHDPLEENNLPADPALAAVKMRLGRELERWMKQQGDRGLATELAAPTRQPGNADPGDSSGGKKKDGTKGEK